ncbi:hypothetical protein MKQ70_08680 [Chitinophaga sedimenti]|uniref:hypothetical protein n=1 Tax=Chitinophaga sedimenti TaxID=2033606 RepID=UPI002003EEA0|nr:hypothetical protein [Chitinophaga sedimenti]MCK7555080.1 hypothetical protein [Chitinophaga sedimenti]
MYNVFTLGGLPVSRFLIMNFFFRGEDIRFVREPIISYNSNMESELGRKGMPTGWQTERFFVTIELGGGHYGCRRGLSTRAATI